MSLHSQEEKEMTKLDPYTAEDENSLTLTQRLILAKIRYIEAKADVWAYHNGHIMKLLLNRADRLRNRHLFPKWDFNQESIDCFTHKCPVNRGGPGKPMQCSKGKETTHY